MIIQDLIAITSLAITILSIITGYLIQRDQKKIRELERENKKLKSNLIKSILAIKGYQILEEEFAKGKNIDLPSYRRSIRKDKSEFFDTDFLTPGNVDRLLNNIQD
jgi:hypothetical protein